MGTALLVGAVLALLLAVGLAALLLVRRRDRTATADGAAPGSGADDRFAPYTGPPTPAHPFAAPPGGAAPLADTAPLPGAAQPPYPPPPEPPPEPPPAGRR